MYRYGTTNYLKISERVCLSVKGNVGGRWEVPLPELVLFIVSLIELFDSLNNVNVVL